MVSWCVFTVGHFHPNMIFADNANSLPLEWSPVRREKNKDPWNMYHKTLLSRNYLYTVVSWCLFTVSHFHSNMMVGGKAKSLPFPL
jgi:hypothetical protein